VSKTHEKTRGLSAREGFPEHPRGRKHEKTRGFYRSGSAKLDKTHGLSIKKSRKHEVLHPRGGKHEKTRGLYRSRSEKLEKTRGLSITKSQSAHNHPKCFKEGSKAANQRTFETILAPRGVAIPASKASLEAQHTRQYDVFDGKGSKSEYKLESKPVFKSFLKNN